MFVVGVPGPQAASVELLWVYTEHIRQIFEGHRRVYGELGCPSMYLIERRRRKFGWVRRIFLISRRRKVSVAKWGSIVVALPGPQVPSAELL